MRFLKNKLLKAKEALERKLASTSNENSPGAEQESLETLEPTQDEPPGPKNTPARQIAKRISQSRQKQSYGAVRNSYNQPHTGNTRATKNIVINFGKAIASFAVSPLATPYLEQILEKENITSKEFTDFVNEAKAGIGGIDSFRLLLLIDESRDTPRLAACKRAFAAISTVFIKYFSVNWITHGRVAHKLTYLKYRFKVLRRIQNPEFFTYISEGKRRDPL